MPYTKSTKSVGVKRNERTKGNVFDNSNCGFKNKTYDCFSKYNDKDILTNNKIVGTCSNNYFQNYILSQQAAFKELYMAQ